MPDVNALGKLGQDKAKARARAKRTASVGAKRDELAPVGRITLASEAPPASAVLSMAIPAANRSTFPNCAVGKLRITYEGDPGVSYGGSAALIADNIALTAGHCIHSPKPGVGRATSITFISSYADDDQSFEKGRWSTAKPADIVAHPDWVAAATQGRENLRADVGVIRLARNESGHSAGKVCGQFGIIFRPDFSNEQAGSLHAFGYPLQPKPKFDGGDLARSVGGITGFLSTFGTPRPAAMWSDMKIGASGGPWVWNKQDEIVKNGKPQPLSKNANFIVGLTSFFWDKYPGRIFSPYFGTSIETFLKPYLPKKS